ncbi:MAG TPA: hypothetical protein PKL06_08085 [Chitinophagales bacterium]|nr:hypothetical protein [Chitinophagales bacterium]
MRTLLLGLILCVVAQKDVQAQSLSDMKMALPSLVERYDMDYHIEGLATVTEELLTGLDLAQYEDLREVDHDIYIVDPATDYTIQLFSVNKALANYAILHKKEGDR